MSTGFDPGPAGLTVPRLPAAGREGAREPGPSASLHDEVCHLAWQVTEASHRLQKVLRHKDRLSRLLDTVLENLDAAVVLLDAEDRVIATNAAARTMKAVRPAAGGRGQELHPEVARVMAGGREARDEAHGEPVLRPEGDGGPAWIVRDSRVALPEGGEGRLLLVHDVTRIVDLEERAHRRSRLELLGRMAAEMAHEVRTPLGSLELFAGLLSDELDERSDARELADQLLLGVRRLSATVTRLLGAARGSRGPRRDTELVGLARDTLALVRPVAFSREIALTLESHEEAVPLCADVEGVRQALLNLLGNALEMTPRGGRVRLTVGTHEDLASVEVSDSGPGVPRDLREKIFEPFFSTREEGTGLGLAVAERVALDHGGTARVGTSEWGGASFRITLSCAAAKSLAAVEPSPVGTVGDER